MATPYVFSPTLYPDVRANIGLDADALSIPDTTLDLPTFKGEAERFIMRNLTEDQYTDADWSAEADAAAVLYLASLVAPTMRVVISERLAGGNMTFANVDLNALSVRLLGQAENRIADIQTGKPSGTPAPIPNPNVFTVASTCRGRRRW